MWVSHRKVTTSYLGLANVSPSRENHVQMWALSRTRAVADDVQKSRSPVSPSSFAPSLSPWLQPSLPAALAARYQGLSTKAGGGELIPRILTDRRHSSYKSLPQLPVVLYFFLANVLWSIENANFWAILAYFVVLSRIYALFSCILQALIMQCCAKIEKYEV